MAAARGAVVRGAAGFDLSWVAERLALGGRFPIEAAAHLAGVLGIRRVVDLRVEDRDDEAVLRAHGIDLLHLPTDDGCAVAPQVIDAGVEWVKAQLDDGERVYIHCQHGIGRSALLTLCVLVSRGEQPLEALARTKHARRVISPSPQQLQAFIGWLEATRGRVHPFAVPTFDDLAWIAYSHLRQSS